MTATALWAAVVASYDNDGLVTLTNIRDASKTTIDTTVGESAAQGVIDIWPIYAQEDYDASSAVHVEVAKRGTISMLWERGGSSSAIAKVEWDEVFSPEGMIAKIRKTGPRARQAPSTNSGVTQSTETSGGRNVRGWSDRDVSGASWMAPYRRPSED